MEYHDQHKKFLPPLEVGQAVIALDPHLGKWADEAIISSIRPDGLSYETTSDGRPLIHSCKMLRLLPNFVHFTSPLLLTPKLQPWDFQHHPSSCPPIRTGNQTEINSGTSISPWGQPGSSSTGPPLVVGYRPSSSSSSSLLPSGSHCITIKGQTRRQDELNCTNSSPLVLPPVFGLFFNGLTP